MGSVERGTADAERTLAAEALEIRAALAFAQAHADTDTQLRLLTAAGRVFRSGSQNDFRDALKAALQEPTSEVGLRGRAESDLAFVEYRRGDYSAAREAAERALDLGEQSNDDDVITSALEVLGIVAVTERDFGRARALHERVLALKRAANNHLGTATTLINLGDVALVAGDYERAITLTTEGIELDRAHGGSSLLQVGLINLAAAQVHLGHLAEAEEAAADSLEVAPDLRDPVAVVFALRVFAAAAAWRRDYERAALLLGGADALDAELGAHSDPSQQALREEVLRKLDGALGVNATAQALDRGRSLAVEEALDLALESIRAGK